jgi:uncharacterized protein (TIGR02266 family)
MSISSFHSLATEESFKDGQVIFKEGSAGDWIFIILSGSVEISKTVGGQKRIIEILSTGEIFGELGFIGGVKRTATAKAIGPTTLGIIDRKFLDNEFNMLSGQFRAILVAVIHRFKKMLERTADFTSRSDPRVPKVLSLEVKDRDSFIKAYSMDIGEGGLSIKTKKPLPLGHEFLLNIQIPERQTPIQVQCEVVWARKEESASAPKKPAGMGVKFSRISNEDRAFLKKYIADSLAKK